MTVIFSKSQLAPLDIALTLSFINLDTFYIETVKFISDLGYIQVHDKT